MRWLKRIVVLLLVLLAIGVAGGFMLPDTVHVEREIVIERPPGQLYDMLNGFHRFKEWSPWADYDPTAKMEFAGPPHGVGAILRWQGEKGDGSQEIIEVVPDRSILVALDFGQDGIGRARFDLHPQGDATRLVWSFDGDFQGSLMGRWFGLLLDPMLGPDYERGLVSLKKLAESEPVAVPPPPAPVEDEAVNDPPGAMPDDADGGEPDEEGGEGSLA